MNIPALKQTGERNIGIARDYSMKGTIKERAFGWVGETFGHARLPFGHT